LTSAYPFLSPASYGTVRFLICTERLRYFFAFYTTFEINSPNDDDEFGFSPHSDSIFQRISQFGGLQNVVLEVKNATLESAKKNHEQTVFASADPISYQAILDAMEKTLTSMDKELGSVYDKIFAE
jgi:hypothetical protein